MGANQCRDIVANYESTIQKQCINSKNGSDKKPLMHILFNYLQCNHKMSVDDVSNCGSTSHEEYAILPISIPVNLPIVDRSKLRFRQFGVPPSCGNFLDRQTLTEQIKTGLLKLSKMPETTALYVTGDNGSGKTTLMSNFLSKQCNQEFLARECGFASIMWLNGSDWMTTTSPEYNFQRFIAVIYAKAEALEGEEIDRQCNVSTFVAYVRAKQRSMLFVFNDVRDSEQMTFLRTISAAEVPCVIILDSNNDTKLAVDNNIVNVDPFPEDELAGLSHVPTNCFGLPLIADLMRSLEQSSSDFSCPEVSTAQEMINFLVKSILLQSLTPEEWQKFYSLVFFTPGQLISTCDIALLWSGEPIVNKMLRKLEILKLVVASGNNEMDEECYVIHQLIHEAAISVAKDSTSIQSEMVKFSPSLLTAIKYKLVDDVKSINSLTSPHIFELAKEAVIQHREILWRELIVTDLAVARHILSEFPEIADLKDGSNRTSLYLAAEIGATDIAEILYKLNRESSEVLNSETGKSPFLVAASNGHLGICRFLAESNARLVRKADVLCNRLPLSWAAENGHFEMVRFLFEKYSSAAKKLDSFEQSALALASSAGNLDIVRYLHMAYSDGIKRVDYEKRSCLSLAAEHGHLPVCRYLAESFPEACAFPSKNGRSPLSWAALNGHLEICKLLYAKNKSAVRLPDKMGDFFPLTLAAMNGHLDVVEFLYQKYPNCIRMQSFLGQTPLLLAASRGHFHVVKFLHEKYSDAVKVAAASGRTALSWAAEHGNLEMATFLVDKYPEAIALTDSETSMNPLWIAIAKNHVDIVILFFESNRQICVNLKDGKSRNALSFAETQSNTKLTHLIANYFNP